MKSFVREKMFVALLLSLGASTPFAAEPTSAPTNAPQPPTLKPADRAFFEQAAQTGILEVQAASIASRKSTKVESRAFAVMMDKDHGSNNADLASMAQQKGMTLPTQLDASHQVLLDKLESEDPSTFDIAYANSMVQGHQEAIRLFEATTATTTDPQIRAFTRHTLPTLQHHLKMAQDLPQKK